MGRKMLRDGRWERIEQLLPGKASDPGCTAKGNRRFVEAVLWIMRAGCPWRDLPAGLGHWRRTFVRFSRWREKGVRERMATAPRGDADTEHPFIGPAIGRAHQHSAGAKKKAGGQGIGRPRGGLAGKLHVAVEALGNPPQVTLPAGQIAGIGRAAQTIEHLPAQAVIADKGYDADRFVAMTETSGAQAVIPPRSNRITQRSFDRHLYRDRNLIEHFFARIKHFRRIATRHDKPAKSFLSFIHLACAFVWLAGLRTDPSVVLRS
ncbi:MAG: IS5 family transposase [Betaproteobacteria bacterium]|nr:IS5 family transposase [Betaproteobacteria bacterium]